MNGLGAAVRQSSFEEVRGQYRLLRQVKSERPVFPYGYFTEHYKSSNLLAVPGRPGAMTRQSAPSTSLLRALDILELIAQKSGGLTNAEISRYLKIATSSTTYIVSRLEQEGYLRREPESGRYEIGLKIVGLAHGVLREMGLRRVAEPILHKLAAETSYSGIIGVFERGFVMIVDKVEQPALGRIDMDIGVRYPAHITALGKVLLAHMPLKDVAGMFDHWGDPQSRSRRGSRFVSELIRELENIKRRGYATSNGELFPGIYAVAAPIFDSSGEVRAAVSVTGSLLRADELSLVGPIKVAAHEISVRLVEFERHKASSGRMRPGYE